jgi:hypothetical protein
MLDRFPDPQPKFIEEPEPDWWLITLRVTLIIVLLAILYMASTTYLAFDPFHLFLSEVSYAS